MKASVWKKIGIICIVIFLLGVSFRYGTGESDIAAVKPQATDAPHNEENNVDSEKSAPKNQKDYIEKAQKSDGFFANIVMNVKLVGKSKSGNKKDLQNNELAKNNAVKATVKEQKKNVNKKSSDKKNTGSKTEKKNKKKSDKKNPDNSEEENAGETAAGEDEKEDGEDKYVTCTILVSCASLVGNMDKLPEQKRRLVPEDGMILEETAVTVKEGSTVFDVLKMATGNNKVQLEYTFSPAYKTYYVEGIGNLYAFDAGSSSGWLYSVNDEFTGYGCSKCVVADGDSIKWIYTCSFGKDAGVYIKEK